MKLEARSLLDFRANPERGYVGGAGWLYFCLDLSLSGYVVWGAPTEDDLGGLVELMVLELDRPPHRALGDVSRVEGTGRPTFEALAGYVGAHQEALARNVTLASVVRPRGFRGAVVGGFFSVVDPTFPVLLADDARSALEQLGYPHPAEAARALDEAQAAACLESPLVRSVRHHLERDLRGSVAATAKRLGVSSRTLQRVLAEGGTSFSTELHEARLRVAERLLLDTDAPVTTIALDVGCGSAQQFSALFRKRRGETPSAFRRRERGR
jgi:AraC-like DNA-binding protein